MKVEGCKVILVCVEILFEDVGGMDVVEGILIARGGMMLYVVVVVCGWGKMCVFGCGELFIDEYVCMFILGGVMFYENDWLSLNGITGEIIRGRVDFMLLIVSEDLGMFMFWVDEFCDMKVLINVDMFEDVVVVCVNGVEGIGFVRTEYMFFGSGERIRIVRWMIMVKDMFFCEVVFDVLLLF